MPTTTPTREKKSEGARLSGPRRRYCPFCKAQVDVIDHKDHATLRRFVTDKGRIRASRITGVCRRHQQQVAVAVKRAREMGLLPSINR
jgi:small subunit ribosomal protein S18